MICGNCGEENPERARFCLACGRALDRAGTAPVEERKVVSILFVDLVGFTASSDRSDPEDVRARLLPYHAMLRYEIERYGGSVEKFIGDAVMAVFGAPKAHEDDTERAVRCALRVTEAIGELNEERPELHLSVRVAVNTGEAVVSLTARPEQGEGIATGDVVNTASRLQQAAPVGAVAVGPVTYRSTKHLFDYEALEPVSLKGKRERLEIWRPVRARSRFGVEIERAQTPFIGREGELALLQQTFARTLRDASVQLVTVTGEPGVGKSRLVSEFFSWIDDLPELVAWRHGRCLPFGEGVTFWALGEIVKAQAGIQETDPSAEASRKLAESVDSVIDEGPDREWVKARLAPLAGTDTSSGPADREESFAAWRTFLEGVASSGPLVLLVEDLHWADDAMLDFIEYVIDWTTDVPLLLLCTARPELYERRADWGGGKRQSTNIGLSPLSGDETAHLISALLPGAVFPAETQSVLLDRSGGNPLYAEEFARMLLDLGILAQRGGTVALDPDREIPIPDSVQALIAARLDTLAPERKAALQDASVVGKVFWSGAVATLGEREPGSVHEELHELARKELVRPARRSSIEGQEEYTFWHILIRDVAYGQIPRAARAAKHRAATDWIEDLAGERVGDHAELLAYHALAALDLATASGDVAGLEDLRARARRFLLLAAERARGLDLGRAMEHCARALELTPKDSIEHGTTLTTLAEMTLHGGTSEEAERLADQAIAEFAGAPDQRPLARAMLTSAQCSWFRGDTDRADATRERAIAILEALAPSEDLARAYSLAAGREMVRGNSRGAIDMGMKALPLIREFGLREHEARVLQFLGIGRFDLGEPGGLDTLRQALDLATATGIDVGLALVNLANVIWETEGPRPALDLYRKAIEDNQRRGDRGKAVWARGEATWVLSNLGRWDELLEIGRSVLAEDLAMSSERTQLSGLVAPELCRVLVHRGMVEEAGEIAAWMVPHARKVGDTQILFPAVAIAALVEAARDDLGGAMGFVEEYRSLTTERPSWRAYWLPETVRIALAAGRMDTAEDLVRGAQPRGNLQANLVRTADALLAEGQGLLERGEGLYGEAAAAWAAFPLVVEQGLAALGAGRCLFGLGRRREGAARVREAHGLFASLGATALIEEADRTLSEAEGERAGKASGI